MKTLITGGAGFIGSHLARALASLGFDVRVLDSLRNGSRRNLDGILSKSERQLDLVVGDCTNAADVRKAIDGVEAVFHFVASPDVRQCQSNPQECFWHNVYSTQILLHEMAKSEARRIIFASTSTVYGDAEKIPTPETYGPLHPISIYGGSKLASEALVMSFAYAYDMEALILRFANIVGPGSSHGVLVDFVEKLGDSPRDLEILGDGAQTKSYLHIEDCIDAIMSTYDASEQGIEVFNVGSEDQTTAARIAEIVIEEMGLDDVKLRFNGGQREGRGWAGDVTNMLLDVTKLKSTGWKPKYGSEEAVRLATRSLLEAGLSRSDEHSVTKQMPSGVVLASLDEWRP